ncbi:MAG: GTPase HflX [Bdellovibrionales bacterium]|nr:GTPase HflX [Bdellovibrionales bacterium]
MIENSESLLPRGNLIALTLGVEEESLSELDRLLDTLGVKTGIRVNAPVRRVVAGTYFGTGKLDEVKLMAEAHADPIDLFVLDVDLTPRQLQNIEKILGKPVLDRTGIILEIFSRHARTRESKTQVELAKLQYVLPRLAHLWNHFERQRGGGVGNKGMGEKQIEVDRRLVKRRIQILRGRLEEIEKERVVQRTSRENLLKVALVGYTNAGKSTLLNALTESSVLAEDKLFATLDATVRALNPDSHPPIVAIDTVGFISRIPTNLIASFRSTLEEIQEADLIVHVVDASSTQAREQYETTCSVLKDLGCEEKEKIVVLNKIDLIDGAARLNQAKIAVPGATRISSLDTEAVKKFRNQLLDHFKGKMETWDLLIPYHEGKLQAKVQEYGAIKQTRYLEKGVFLQVMLDSTIARKLDVRRYTTAKREEK